MYVYIYVYMYICRLQFGCNMGMRFEAFLKGVHVSAESEKVPEVQGIDPPIPGIGNSKLPFKLEDETLDRGFRPSFRTWRVRFYGFRV